jgi:hypothetical protein
MKTSTNNLKCGQKIAESTAVIIFLVRAIGAEGKFLI